jgi:hypothetical protein
MGWKSRDHTTTVRRTATFEDRQVDGDREQLRHPEVQAKVRWLQHSLYGECLLLPSNAGTASLTPRKETTQQKSYGPAEIARSSTALGRRSRTVRDATEVEMEDVAFLAVRRRKTDSTGRDYSANNANFHPTREPKKGRQLSASAC